MSEHCVHEKLQFIGRKFYRGVWYKIFWCPDCGIELPKVDKDQKPNKPG